LLLFTVRGFTPRALTVTGFPRAPVTVRPPTTFASTPTVTELVGAAGGGVLSWAMMLALIETASAA
jgi:hypothetical protein